MCVCVCSCTFVCVCVCVYIHLSDSEHEQRDRVNMCACLLVCMVRCVLACSYACMLGCVLCVCAVCVCVEQQARQHNLGLSLSESDREQPFNCQRDVITACLLEEGILSYSITGEEAPLAVKTGCRSHTAVSQHTRNTHTLTLLSVWAKQTDSLLNIFGEKDRSA